MHLVAERRYLLPPVVEETRFVRLDDDDVKQVPPVLPYDVVHSSIAEREGKGGRGENAESATSSCW